MGCLWACKLAEQGHRVQLIFRNASSLAEYQSLGKLILETDGRTTSHEAQGTCSEQLNAPIKNLLIATKAQDALQAFEDIRPLLTDTSEILLLQNGVSAQWKITRENPGLCIYCLTSSHGVWQKKRFHSVHAGTGEIWMGRLNNPAANFRTKALLDTLPVESLKIKWDDDINSRMWRKLAVNCVVNGLSVIYECNNGGLQENLRANKEMKILAKEIEIIINEIDSAPNIYKLFEQVEEVIATTADNYSSMLQDFRVGKKLEIDHLNNFLCQQATSLGLSCERNREIVDRILLKTPTTEYHP